MFLGETSPEGRRRLYLSLTLRKFKILKEEVCTRVKILIILAEHSWIHLTIYLLISRKLFLKILSWINHMAAILFDYCDTESL